MRDNDLSKYLGINIPTDNYWIYSSINNLGQFWLPTFFPYIHTRQMMSVISFKIFKILIQLSMCYYDIMSQFVVGTLEVKGNYLKLGHFKAQV